MQAGAGGDAAAWQLWDRWISEIVADLWSIARIGVGSTMGLMTIVSLPRPFVFHMTAGDPHPIPWMRVRLSCAIGHALYPDSQWKRLSDLWAAFYPLRGEMTTTQRHTIAALEQTLPTFVRFLLSQRPPALGGRTLYEAFRSDDRNPATLRARYGQGIDAFHRLRATAPALACAVIGQARADGAITPEHESRLLGDLLMYWALRAALHTTQFVADRSRPRAGLAAAS